MKNEQLLKDFLGKRYAIFIEQFYQLPVELRQLIGENRELMEDMLANKFDLGTILSACEPEENV